jgi:hypothetical protein
MPAPEELPWLTARRDEVARLEQLADLVDRVTVDPNGLAAALRNTPTYLKALPERGAFPSERTSPSVG